MARPSAPTNVAATEGVPTITITWDAVVEANAYVVYRSPTSDDLGFIIGVTDDLFWIDTTAVFNQTYYYSVQTRADSVCSDPSTPDSGVAVPDRANILNPPTNLVVTVIV